MYKREIISEKSNMEFFQMKNIVELEEINLVAKFQIHSAVFPLANQKLENQ
jgi:hypothetical protein